MNTNIDHLRSLYGEPDRPTNSTARPQPGDAVTIDGLPGVFEVLSFDGTTFTLRSEHGVTCRAGCLVVRELEQQKEQAA